MDNYVKDPKTWLDFITPIATSLIPAFTLANVYTQNIDTEVMLPNELLALAYVVLYSFYLPNKSAFKWIGFGMWLAGLLTAWFYYPKWVCAFYAIPLILQLIRFFKGDYNEN